MQSRGHDDGEGSGQPGARDPSSAAERATRAMLRARLARLLSEVDTVQGALDAALASGVEHLAALGGKICLFSDAEISHQGVSGSVGVTLGRGYDARHGRDGVVVAERGFVGWVQVPLRCPDRVRGFIELTFARPIEASVTPAMTLLADLLCNRIRHLCETMTRAQSEERLRAFVETASDGIVTIDASGTILFVNAAMTQLFGHSSAELLGADLSLLIPEGMREAHERALKRASAPGVAGQGPRRRVLEVEGLHKSGARVPVEISFSSFEKGGRLTYNGIIRDMTARRRAEATAAEIHARFRQLAENIRDVFWMTLPDKQSMVYISPAYEDVWGRPCEELYEDPMSWVNAIHPEDRPRVLEEALTQQTRGGYEVEYRIVRPDGTIRWIHDRAFPVLDERGVCHRVVGIAKDISESKRVNQALMVAKEEAIKAAETKTQFLANMSHEIRTPMNGVIGMLDLLLETPLSPQQRAYAETVARSARHLLGVLNDVLDFSKLESGNVRLSPVPFSLRDMLEHVRLAFALEAESKGLRLTVQIDPAIPAEVWADELRLQQVLMNVVGNAVKFTSAGQVQVAAHHEGKQGECHWCRFEVVDSGPGISPEVRTRLFRVFSQGDASVTRRHGGTGLGLAISRGLVELMGGSMGLDSEVGRGSRFHWTLPLAAVTSDAAPTPAPAPGAPIKSPGHPRLEGKVLAAEDNLVNQAVMRSMLETLGCTVDLVANGQEAVARLTSHDYDLVLMDCQMPELDGYGATRALRQRDPRPIPLPVLALTAHALDGDRQRCLACGMDDYLRKPVRLEQLRQLVTTWLAPPLSSETLDELAAIGGGEFLETVLSTFLRQSSLKLEGLHAALSRGDGAAVSPLAHALKGEALAVGAHRLAAFASELDHDARAGNLSSAPGVIAALEREWKRVRGAAMAHISLATKS